MRYPAEGASPPGGRPRPSWPPSPNSNLAASAAPSPEPARRTRQLPATKPPKLSAERQDKLRRLAETGEPVRELAAASGIGRATAYRYLSPARK